MRQKISEIQGFFVYASSITSYTPYQIVGKLTATAVNQAKPTQETYKMTDGGGLYLKVDSKGGKYWRYDYRFTGKRKTLSIGVYP